MAQYLRYNEQGIKKGDVVFTFKMGSWISRLIWRISSYRFGGDLKTKVSHVAMYAGSGKVIEADWEGIVENDIKKKYDPHKYRLYIGTSEDLKGRDEMVEKAYKYVGHTKYPFLQLVVIAVKKLFGLHKTSMDVDVDNMICSEFIVMLYREAGVDLLPGIYAHDCSPLDIFNSKELVVRDV